MRFIILERGEFNGDIATLAADDREIKGIKLKLTV